MYKPYRDNGSEDEESSLKYNKQPNHVLPRGSSEFDGQQRAMTLRRLSNVGGFATVFMPGLSPSFIVRTTKCSPHVLNIRSEFVCGLAALSTTGCESGLIYVDDQVFSDVSYNFKPLKLKRDFRTSCEVASYRMVSNSTSPGRFAESPWASRSTI
jgi:cleavage and polyadenylation specificity factor subunit 1